MEYNLLTDIPPEAQASQEAFAAMARNAYIIAINNEEVQKIRQRLSHRKSSSEGIVDEDTVLAQYVLDSEYKEEKDCESLH